MAIGALVSEFMRLLGSKIIPPQNLGSGHDPAKFLRGDSTWQTPAGGSGGGDDTVAWVL